LRKLSFSVNDDYHACAFDALLTQSRHHDAHGKTTPYSPVEIPSAQPRP